MAILSSTTVAHNELLLCSSYAVSEDANSTTNPVWRDGWKPWTARGTNDGDNNSYYLGRYTYSNGSTYYHWWPRLKFTIPANAGVGRSNSLTLTLDVQGMNLQDRQNYFDAYGETIGGGTTRPTEANYFYSYPVRAFLTTYIDDSVSDPAVYLDKWANNTDPGFIADTWMRKSNGNIASGYLYAYQQLTFTFTNFAPLKAGTTYYIYLMAYRYGPDNSSGASSITSPRFQSIGFNGENMGSDEGDNSSSSYSKRNRGYTTLEYDYEPGTVWINTGTESAPNWQRAIPWIHNGTEWKQAIPWIHNGTEWKISGG